jgi:8-oxo-dGTP pyrophosphatase MutT (NUDIX family)
LEKYGAPRAEISEMEIESFLARYESFSVAQHWEWLGVPLEARFYLVDDLPPREYVGSVRAFVLRDNNVLVVQSSPPVFSVGGRCEPGETIEQTLVREVVEESGWRVKPLAVIGFVHCRHLDAQRPDWGRPAPDFIDPIFAASAVEQRPEQLGQNELPSEFVPVATVEEHGIDEVSRIFLREALRKRALCRVMG